MKHFHISRRSSFKKIIAVGVFVWVGSSLSAVATDGTSIKLSDFINEVKIKGDLRLRHESIHRSNQSPSPADTSSRDRHRQRFRLRVGIDFMLPENFAVKTRFASGGGDQNSTNQSFDNLGSEKGFWIDRAYLKWSPGKAVALMGGKMANPYWTPYSADVVWDGDFNPEGFGGQFNLPSIGESTVFVNVLQMTLDEGSTGREDQAYFGGQVGTEIPFSDSCKFTGAFALHEWVNERSNSFGQPTEGDGNRKAGSVLLNEFRVIEYTGEFASKLGEVPLSLQGTIVHNNKSNLNPSEDDGFQYGVIVGKAKKKGSFEGGLFYKRVETDATVADVADSDFGDKGGTNRKGAIGWLAYAPTDFSVFQVKHFVTKTLDSTLSPGVKPVQRTQVDFSVKF